MHSGKMFLLATSFVALCTFAVLLLRNPTNASWIVQSAAISAFIFAAMQLIGFVTAPAPLKTSAAYAPATRTYVPR